MRDFQQRLMHQNWLAVLKMTSPPNSTWLCMAALSVSFTTHCGCSPPESLPAAWAPNSIALDMHQHIQG
jgi:hypothetical protein